MTERIKILIVEDEPELAKMFSLALTKAGYGVLVLSDGANITAKVAQYRPDFILLDIVMPNVDGYQAFAALKKNFLTREARVFVWSNLTQEEEIAKAKKMGAEDYWIKSDFTPAKLVEKIKKVFAVDGAVAGGGKK